MAKIRFQTNLDSKHLFVVTLTLVVFKGRWRYYICCNKQSLAPSWIKISISNGDRRLHATTKVIMQKEKNTCISKTRGLSGCSFVKVKVKTTPSVNKGK